MRIHRHLVPLFLLLAGSALAQAADPVLRNWGMGAFRGMDTSVTVQSLSATDADTTAANLVFTITTAPTKGSLRLNGVDLVVTGTFSQADIAGGLVSYRHVAGANDAMDVVAFTLSDGTATQAHTVRILVGPSAGASFRMQKVGEYRVPSGFNADGGVAEIVGYDPNSRRLMLVNGVTNTVDVLAFGNDDFAAPTLVASLQPSTTVATATNVTSVAVKNGLIAVAIGHTTKTTPGYVFFYTAATGAYVSHIDFSTALSQVGGVRGALPDMVTFTPDGSKVLVAIEAEPASDYSIDPDGGVVVVAVTAGVPAASATWIGFDDANTAAYQAAGVRIYNDRASTAPTISAAKDLEPEYITISADSTTAYVSLQENNAVAVYDLTTNTLTAVRALGLKDHNQPGTGMDSSDRDGAGNTVSINVGSRPFRGMYQPDGMAILSSGHLLTANEGDARDYSAMAEESRMSVMADADLDLDWRNLNTKANTLWARLTVTKFGLFFNNANATVEAPQVLGARSFSVWNSSGALVWDSGDQFEQFFAIYGNVAAPGDGALKFNSTHSENAPDTRSDNKGPEPESIVTGTVDGRTYAFVGLERIGGVMVYDVTIPAAPTFVTYYTGRLFHQTPGNASGGDLGPEGMLFIEGAKSPTGRPMLIVGNEVSGTVAIHEIITGPYVETLIVADSPNAGDLSGVAAVASTPTTFPTADLATTDPQVEALVINGGNAAGSTLTVSGATATYTPGTTVSGADTLTFTAADYTSYASEVPRGLLVTTASGIDSYLSGYGSAMANVPGKNDEFWLMTDRGANVDGRLNPGDITTSANVKIFPEPSFQPRMIKVRVLADGTIEKLADVRFKNGDGSPMTGKPFIGSGAGATGETGYSLDLATNQQSAIALPSDADGLDPEGLVVRNDGSFWVSDEYGPWIVGFDSTGTVTQRIGPFGTTGTATSPNPNARKLPAVFSKRRANRGMEGLSITPSGWLVGMMQSPMLNPSSAAIGGTSGANASRVCRILFFNPTDGLTKQYTYVLDSASTAVSEILAVNENEFLVLERDGNWPGGAPASAIKKIYRIHVGQATDVSDPADGANGKLYTGKTVEELKTTAGLRAEGITPVRKWLAVDMLLLTNQTGGAYPHDKPEGLALVNGGKTLVLVNDDDFGVVPSSAPIGGVAAKQIPLLANRVDFNSLWFIGLDDGSLATTVTNTAPVMAPQSFTLAANGAGTGTLVATDAEPQTLRLTLVANAATTDGSVTVAANGGWTFTPAATFDGTATFTASVSDGIATTGPVSISLAMPAGYSVLQILHTSDGEASIPAIDDLPRFSAVLNALRGTMSSATMTVASGDNWLPSPFYNASGDPAAAALPGIGVASVGRGDIAAMNFMGFQASCFGNHEFDAGTREVRNILLNSGAWGGAQFPYLSSNLTFTGNADLSSLVAADGQLANTLAKKIAGTTTIMVNGVTYGLIGATTPLLPSISSPGTVVTTPSNPTDYAALAAIIQTRVNALRLAGITRIILLAHMQQYQIEADELAPRLDGVDVIIAGGSHAVFADNNDRLRTGDTAAQTYPLWRTSSVGEQVAVLQAGANWRYVGRLVATFDDLGRILPTSVTTISGVYATDAQGVTDLSAGGLVNADVQAIATGLGNIVNSKDGELYGRTTVFLNGLRASVRTEETNLGNLSADANLAAGRVVDTTAILAIKNGGGIRDAIGTVGTGATPTYLPPQANPSASKPEGAISRLDIENSLRFNNSLAMLTVTAAQLKELLEHSVAGSGAGLTPGQFPQVSGLRFSWNPAGTAQVLAGGSFAVTTPGTRVQTVVINDVAGKPVDVVVSAGALVGDPARTFRVVTLNFLETGGDSYPFPKYRTENPTRYSLVDLSAAASAGFSVTGFEQDAFADHMLATYPLSGAGYQRADTAASADLRIQNTTLRTATQFAPFAAASAVTTAEDTASTGTITLTDPDTAAATLITTVTVANPTLLGATLTGTGTGTGATRTLNLTPLTNRNGATTVTVTVSDGVESTTTAVVVTVTPVNDAPLAANAAVTATVAVALAGNLIADDVDGGALTFSTVSNPTKGTATVVAGTGAFTYTANAGASGTDTFTFKVNDGGLDSNIATVTVTIVAAGGGGSSGSSGGDSNSCGLGGGVSAMLLLLLLAMTAVLRRRD